MRGDTDESAGAANDLNSYFRNLAPNDGMPSGDTSFDACIASARQSFLILRWQRVLFDQSTLARMYLTRRSVYQESLLGMKVDLFNPILLEAQPEARDAMPSPIHLMMANRVPTFIFRRRMSPSKVADARPTSHPM